MSTHYASAHFASTHHASSHFGGLGAPIVLPEEGGGSGGPTARQPHGVYIPTVRVPRDIAEQTTYDDADLALLAVMLIEEFYD